MDDLTKALMAAGAELAEDHGWGFDGDPGMPPAEDGVFITVLRKHLINVGVFRNARIASLKAELEILEGKLN